MTGITVVRRSAGAWVDLNQSVTPPPPPPAQLFAGDPGPGKIIWGIGHQGGVSDMPDRAATFASDVGLSGHLYPRVARRYIQPFSTIAQGKSMVDDAFTDLAIVKAWGGLSFLDSKELTTLDFAGVGSGGMDQYLDYLMTGALAYGAPIIIGFHQEPVTDSLGTATDYASAITRFVQRRNLAGATNVTITGCIGFGSFTNATTAQSKDNNGTFVDWAQALGQTGQDVWGSHKYLQYHSGDATKWASGWNMDKLFGQFWDVQNTVDSTLARVHGEWGVHTSAGDLTQAPQFMDDMMTYGIAHNLRVASFFDSGLNSNMGGSWSLDIPIQGGDGSVDPSRRIHMARQLLDPRVSFPIS